MVSGVNRRYVSVKLLNARYFVSDMCASRCGGKVLFFDPVCSANKDASLYSKIGPLSRAPSRAM